MYTTTQLYHQLKIKMSSSLDVFGGASTQELGKEMGEGVVYSVSLKRVRYGSQTSDGPEGHLQWNSRKVRTLRAGTLEKLVENLAPWREPIDVSYRTCFLCTYRTFTSAEVVLQLLVRRFNNMEPLQTDSPTDAADKTEVQNYIISFFRLWLESHPKDFYCPPPTHHPLLSHLHPLTLVSPVLQRMVDNLQLDFETKEALQNESCDTSVDSGLGGHTDSEDREEEYSRLKEKNFDLCTLDPEQFAKCLTAEDAELFQRVIPHHCLDYVCDTKDLENAPSVRACIQHFNRVSLIVIATIIGESECERRGSKIARWIDIAQQCRAIKNFSSLKAIVSGLHSSSVYRLRKSWQTIASSKLALFQELASLLAADSNHQTSRDLLNREGTAKYAELSPRKSSKVVKIAEMHGSIQGVVPYLGMYLTDLTMVHSAHKDLTETGLVNFDKSRKLFEILAQLTLYQKSSTNYQFPSHCGLVEWLKSTHTYTQKESYLLSKQLEPEDSPPHLHPPPLTHPPLSPSRIKRTIKHLFNSKGSIVSDLTTSTPSPTSPPSHSSLISKQLSDSPSYEQLNNSWKKETGKKFRKRSNSLSPSIGRRYCDNQICEDKLRNDTCAHPLPGHVIRVAMTHNDHCNYKCLLLSENDRAGVVIERAIKKFSVKESHSNFTLVQMVQGKKRVEIPTHANVYYALCNTGIESETVKATLLLVRKEPIQ